MSSLYVLVKTAGSTQRRIASLCVACVLLAVVPCARLNAQSVSGTIRDQKDGPIPGAVVLLYSPSGTGSVERSPATMVGMN
ncbi:MAG: hypothetical protein U0163_09680 [Gemmatimonadaceae bacterium]